MPAEAKYLPHGFPIAAKPHYEEEELGNLTYASGIHYWQSVDLDFTAAFSTNNLEKCQATFPPPSDRRFRILSPSTDNLLKEEVISLHIA